MAGIKQCVRAECDVPSTVTWHLAIWVLSHDEALLPSSCHAPGYSFDNFVSYVWAGTVKRIDQGLARIGRAFSEVGVVVFVEQGRHCQGTLNA